MKFSKVLPAIVIASALTFSSCQPKDADVDASVEKVLNADPMMAGTMVEVKDGVATITGECKDDACKAACEKAVAAVKGVKSVVNNCSVAPPPPPPPAPPASLSTTLDEATQQLVKDGLKDIKAVSVEFLGDKAVLSGEVSKADRMKIMQMLAAAKVKSDVTRLTDKK
ncbi:MAG: BON domain-containing protein [Bacteroidetes bacterium]|nr:BON domain-containing protein [Bacteroidota bacterium]